jgi:CDP-glycerol glycerophosphotransferase (TagB/SpsB family)
MANQVEPTSEDLYHKLEDARWIWEEAARVYRLHGELASLYRTRSNDKRTIRTLWEKIDEGEAALRLVGVQL